MSGILFKASNKYCSGSGVDNDGVAEAEFDGWDKVNGEPDVLWGMNSTMGFISPTDFSSFSCEKSKHWRSEGGNTINQKKFSYLIGEHSL